MAQEDPIVKKPKGSKTATKARPRKALPVFEGPEVRAVAKWIRTAPRKLRLVADMVRAGARTAHGMGMQPYYLYRQKYMAGNQENVGYALPGHACLYNVEMMEETANVLAMGAGAASKRLFDRQGFIRRAFNVSDIRQYISRVDEMAQRKRDLFLGGNAPASCKSENVPENA